VQHLQQSHTKDRSGRASDADDKACGLRLFHDVGLFSLNELVTASSG
jgi:hypothetical protein